MKPNHFLVSQVLRIFKKWLIIKRLLKFSVGIQKLLRAAEEALGGRVQDSDK
jgi:hypothetical protein